jgi:hypothetical protein
MNHRREFIKTTSAAMLALGMAPGTLATSPRRIGGRGRIVPLSELHYADFAERLDTPFHVTESSGAVLPLLLAEAQDMSYRFGGENFSVVFHGPSNQPLSQGTYKFEHRGLGVFPLFIVPMLGDGRNAHYEAVFNRMAAWKAAIP